MIDTHTHLSQLRIEDSGLRSYQFLRWMDRLGIEKVIIVVVEVPEELDFFVIT
tara:strand:- start:374 stop:532 length:159 start_codon:yes stop_codon:yes gene_type:complete